VAAFHTLRKAPETQAMDEADEVPLLLGTCPWQITIKELDITVQTEPRLMAALRSAARN
jgi:hypothetical protein